MQHSVAGPYSEEVIKSDRCIFLGAKVTRMKEIWGNFGHRRVKRGVDDTLNKVLKYGALGGGL